MNILQKMRQLKEDYYYLPEQEDEENPPKEEETAPEEEPVEDTPPESGEEEAVAGGSGEGAEMTEEEPANDLGTEEGGEEDFGGEEEEGKTLTDLGRIYELNKIYYRLVAISKILKNSSDSNLIMLREKVSEVLTIFKLVIDNLATYKDKIDEIIIMYYKFINKVLQKVEIYYKKKKEIQQHNLNKEIIPLNPSDKEKSNEDTRKERSNMGNEISPVRTSL
tara:strand:- start:1534 stop:2196 length:663 start_codon:yes stop_codon:yes gene_type:complete